MRKKIIAMALLCKGQLYGIERNIPLPGAVRNYAVTLNSIVHF